MCQPTDDWLCKYDQSPEPDNEYRRIDVDADQPVGNTTSPGTSEQEADFTFPCGPSASEEEDEVLTEQKIKAFLEEKVAPSLLHIIISSCNLYLLVLTYL